MTICTVGLIRGNASVETVMNHLEVKDLLQALCNHLPYYPALPGWPSLPFLQYVDHLATCRCFNIDSVTMF